TSQGFFSASSAAIAAINSIRLLVVWGSPPEISLRCSPNTRMAPKPPGPGLPEQAPSVWMTTRGRAVSDFGDGIVGPLCQRPSPQTTVRSEQRPLDRGSLLQ